jgi:hypothetical protein
MCRNLKNTVRRSIYNRIPERKMLHPHTLIISVPEAEIFPIVFMPILFSNSATNSFGNHLDMSGMDHVDIPLFRQCPVVVSLTLIFQRVYICPIGETNLLYPILPSIFP